MGALKSITHSYTYNQYLFWYIERNDIPNIQKILQKKPQLINESLTVNFKTTPLHRASVNGNLQLVQLLIQKYHAEINHKTSNGQTPLIGAIKKNQIQIVRYLLSLNVNTDQISGSGLKAIDYAVLAGFYDIALVVYQKMKVDDLKDQFSYEEIGKKFQYRYVNYKVFLENLRLKIDEENVADFLIKQKKLLDDPVVDPRESWKNWFLRNLDFKDPPLCERNQLPEEMQPQNRRFGKLRHYFSAMAMTHLTQKPVFLPHKQTQSLSENPIHNKNVLVKQQQQTNSIQSV